VGYSGVPNWVKLVPSGSLLDGFDGGANVGRYGVGRRMCSPGLDLDLAVAAGENSANQHCQAASRSSW